MHRNASSAWDWLFEYSGHKEGRVPGGKVCRKTGTCLRVYVADWFWLTMSLSERAFLGWSKVL